MDGANFHGEMKQGRDEGCRWNSSGGREGPWDKVTFEKIIKDTGMSHLAI